MPKFSSATRFRILLITRWTRVCAYSFAVNPSTLLTKCYQTLTLYCPTKANVMALREQLSNILDEVPPCDHEDPVMIPEELSLSRLDLTADLYFIKSADISSLICLFS